MAKLIVCGSRSITDYSVVKDLIKKGVIELGLKGKITEVVSGGAKGVDILSERCAAESKIRVKKFIPDWDTLGKKAGMMRNVDMCEYVKPDGAVICIHDGESRGSLQCYNYAVENGLKAIKYTVKPDIWAESTCVGCNKKECMGDCKDYWIAERAILESLKDQRIEF